MGADQSVAPNGHYRALLVDYGGVLTSSPLESFRAFCDLEGLEPDAVAATFGMSPENRQLLFDFECGRIDEPAFESRFAELLGVADPERLIDRLFAAYEPDEQMVAAIRNARRAGIRTGLISNSWGTRRYDRRQLAELFDGVVISGEVGIRKPEPRIYELGAERAGAPPEACVFVDDLPWNLGPAAELGMATVHHVAHEQTIDELERLLGVPLR
jgi:putative hydrolase of the HAD superfamily